MLTVLMLTIYRGVAASFLGPPGPLKTYQKRSLRRGTHAHTLSWDGLSWVLLHRHQVDCNGSDGGLGGTGSNDEISTLKGKVASLTFENMGLQRELEKLQGQLQALSLNEPGAAGGGEDEAEEEPSDEAVRKRLHRLFKRRSDGTFALQVRGNGLRATCAHAVVRQPLFGGRFWCWVSRVQTSWCF